MIRPSEDNKRMEAVELKERIYDIRQNDISSRRRLLVKRVEDFVRKIIRSIVRKERPSFYYDDGKHSGWSSNCNSVSSSNSSNFSENDSVSSGVHMKTIRFSGNESRQRFALIMRIMAYVHDNLIKNLDHTENEFYCTKRSFFYSLKNEDIKRFVKKQGTVEWAINEVTMLLDCGPWEIGFISTSKGLVAGDLSLHLSELRIINYDPRSCLAVPDVIANVTRIRTRADFVLVVEKDSVFQKLLREDCPTFNNCILVTGKGYPDIVTRMLVNILSEHAQLPIYALVDANPYGFEIMCVYRYGTVNNLGYREKLLCPAMRWLGIHQDDLIKLGISRVRLTKEDMKKIRDLQNRIYVDVDFSQHLIAMRYGKAEIESVIMPIKRFLSEVLIPTKIRKKEYF